MKDPWVGAAREELVRLLDGRPGWGYRIGGEPCTEPTVLASLALLSSPAMGSPASIRSAVASASGWLASIQQADGSVGISGSLQQPRWPTSYAVLLWASERTHGRNREKAVQWLLRQRGLSLPRDPNEGGHDTSLVGWPWVEETHSWLEPTCLAVLALAREGLARHEHVAEGIRLIRNRAIATGGWNYGNSAVYGTDLRPQPAPTGIALVAMAGLSAACEEISKACRYLGEVLPRIRSPQSLCWGLLGLSAWRLRPAEADLWLSESFERARRYPDRAIQLAYLLMASADQSLRFLGVEHR